MKKVAIEFECTEEEIRQAEALLKVPITQDMDLEYFNHPTDVTGILQGNPDRDAIVSPLLILLVSMKQVNKQLG